MAIKPIRDSVGVPNVQYQGTFDEALIDQTGLRSAIESYSETKRDEIERFEENVSAMSEIQDEVLGETFHNIRQKAEYDNLLREENITDADIWSVDFSNPYARIELERRAAKVTQRPEYQRIKQEMLVAESFLQDYLEDPSKYGELGEDLIASYNAYLEDADIDDPFYATDIDPNSFIAGDYETSLDAIGEKLQSTITTQAIRNNGATYAVEIERKSIENISDAMREDLLSSSEGTLRLLEKRGLVEFLKNGSPKMTAKGNKYLESKAKKYKVDKETYQARLSSTTRGSTSSSTSGDTGIDALNTDVRKSIWSKEKPTAKERSVQVLDDSLRGLGITNENIETYFDSVYEMAGAYKSSNISTGLVVEANPQMLNTDVVHFAFKNGFVPNEMIQANGWDSEFRDEYNNSSGVVMQNGVLFLSDSKGRKISNSPIKDDSGNVLQIGDLVGEPEKYNLRGAAQAGNFVEPRSFVGEGSSVSTGVSPQRKLEIEKSRKVYDEPVGVREKPSVPVGYSSLRANNPLNLRPPNDKENFYTYENMLDGIQDASKLLNRYYTGENKPLQTNKELIFKTKGKPVTIEEVIKTWAPTKENARKLGLSKKEIEGANDLEEVENYVNTTVKMLQAYGYDGVKKDTPVNDIEMDDMMLAMIKTECPKCYEKAEKEMSSSKSGVSSSSSTKTNYDLDYFLKD